MRISLALVVVASFIPECWAQQEMRGRRRPAPPPRVGGTLQLSTGAWTRKALGASLGADTIYDNTCRVGYFASLSGDTFVDEGRLPSLTSPNSFSSRPGCATSYEVDGFQLFYCTDQASLGTLEMGFFESYAACSTVVGVTPTASFALNGLPASSSGLVQCWLVDIDLDAVPGVGLSFPMLADGDGTYSTPDSSNLFGWSIRCSLPWAAQARTGPAIAGDFNVCSRFDGTRWDSPVNYAEDGNGAGMLDQMRIESGPSVPGCYFFCGGPVSSLHLELYADACPTQAVGASFCFGDGSGTACPCGNTSAPALQAGCLNSLGLAATIRAAGYARISADSVRLDVASMPPSSSSLLFQGTTRVNAGLGTAFGDGLRCAGGAIVRIATRANDAAGASSYPSPGDPALSVQGQVTAPGVRTYQAWYRNAASFCTPSTFNLTNGVEVAWTL